jgi:hypothetical protein
MKIESSFTPDPFIVILSNGGNGAVGGTVVVEGGSEPPQPILNGRISGSDIYWELAKPVLSKFRGKVSAGAISGTVEAVGQSLPFSALPA